MSSDQNQLDFFNELGDIERKCICNRYKPIELRRDEVEKRIEESAQIIERLERLASHPEYIIDLYRCNICGQHWQTGWEWAFAAQIYVFQVPETTLDEWLSEPFRQPASMLIYTALMRNFMEHVDATETALLCRHENCPRHAIQYSAFCLDHHIDMLQTSGGLPKEPFGRIFPPYRIRSS